MKKRSQGIKGQNALPLTESDRHDAESSSKKRKKRRPLTPLQASACLFVAIITGGLLVATVQRNFFPSPSTDAEEQSRRLLVSQEHNLPLQSFPSLQYALSNSEITLLYFAASWCPMSTPVTEKIDEVFQDVLLDPPGEDDSPRNLVQRHGVSLVYVSSDRTEEEMQEYIKPKWMVVPFESEEREALKRRFATCARRELQELGMERKHEIPTLIVLSGPTHSVLTFHGIKDMEEYGINAIDHWLELEHLSTALGEKFADER